MPLYLTLPDFVGGVLDLLNRTDGRIVQNYLIWRYVQAQVQGLHFSNAVILQDLQKHMLGPENFKNHINILETGNTGLDADRNYIFKSFL